jgi:hypothetical protein
MPTIITNPQVFPPTFRNQQEVVTLSPLFGVAGQINEVETSPWVKVPAGSYLQVSLVITALVGGAAPATPTLSVIVETCNQINSSGVAVDAPRFLGSFLQQPNATLPSRAPLTGSNVCDNYIRVIGTPGGANTTASWTVAGQAIAAAYSSGTA